jgi:hypothetical protein
MAERKSLSHCLTNSARHGSIGMLFLNCTKNIELTYDAFDRTFTFALTQELPTARPRTSRESGQIGGGKIGTRVSAP